MFCLEEQTIEWLTKKKHMIEFLSLSLLNGILTDEKENCLSSARHAYVAFACVSETFTYSQI